MKTVFSLEEARAFFMRNREDSVKCVDGDREQECECYPEAEAFYQEAGK